MSDGRTEADGNRQEPPRGEERRGRVSLPANRAFVVQFRVEDAEEGSFSGRFEHVTTGRVQHFESSSELVAGLSRALARVDALSDSSAGRSPNPTNRIRLDKKD